ncbi:GFA family protein [Phyllobacterium sp. 628]|uniref:GFA family protein n=1 Tax=Phyllobacterium sp. 628 TaxID=2718938 RepID=UPI0016622AD6|nr:GFA family protein [Phyllobacterium sp. 628]QND52424.1 GFA family protein [Phyllobacterium sp. 628]
MKKTYHGSCHCQSVRFECDIDLQNGTSKCNCSSCSKGRFWKAFVGRDAMRIVAGADNLAEYRFGSKTIAHFFCKTCGVKPFGRGEMEAMGGVFYAVNLVCLDDLTTEELLAAPVDYQDGLHNQWEQTPSETRHL